MFRLDYKHTVVKTVRSLNKSTRKMFPNDEDLIFLYGIVCKFKQYKWVSRAHLVSFWLLYAPQYRHKRKQRVECWWWSTRLNCCPSRQCAVILICQGYPPRSIDSLNGPETSTVRHSFKRASLCVSWRRSQHVALQRAPITTDPRWWISLRERPTCLYPLHPTV